MKLNRTLVSTAVVLSALVAAGCDATAFNAFNEQFKTIKSSSTTLKSSTMPAAAMATSLAAIEVMNALSSKNQERVKGGGIIAPGGLNFRIASVLETNYVEDEAAKTGTLKAVRDDKTILDLSFGYDLTQTGNNYKYELKDLKGVAHGFTIAVGGTYNYTNKSGDPSTPKGDVDCTVKGSMEVKDSKTKFELPELHFKMTFPIEDQVKREIGALVLQSADGGKFDGKVFMAGTTVTASATVTEPNGDKKTYDFDEKGVATTTETAAK